MDHSQILLPGDPLPAAPRSAPGHGTYLSPSLRTAHASRAGILLPSPSKPGTAHTTVLGPPTPPLPSVGDVLLGRVTRVTPRTANLDLLAYTPLESSRQGQAVPLAHVHAAQLRLQDVRLHDLERTSVAGSFAVNDLVRCKVVGLGDERGYYVSTVGDEFGVVLGFEGGRWCVGTGWEGMVDGEGVAVKGRKVARVV